MSKRKKNILKKGILILQFDKKGKYITFFRSLKEVEAKLGFSTQLISQAAMSRKRGAGFIWRYYDPKTKELLGNPVIEKQTIVMVEDFKLKVPKDVLERKDFKPKATGTKVLTKEQEERAIAKHISNKEYSINP